METTIFLSFSGHPSDIGFSPDLLNLNNCESNFLFELSFLNFFKFNIVLNSTGSMLDLVLSNLNNLFVKKSVNPLVPCDN